MPADYFRRYHPSEIFGNHAPCEIDLGCGEGKFLTELAAHCPQHNFLGVERLLGRVRKVARKINKQAIPNAKVLRLETQYTVQWLLAKESIHRVHLLCPDPWPKAKHHKRRIFQVDFLNQIHQLLSNEGELLFKTDHPDYYQWAIDELEKTELFSQSPWPEDAFFYPKTDFQLHWEAQGKCLFRLRLAKKCNSPSPTKSPGQSPQIIPQQPG